MPYLHPQKNYFCQAVSINSSTYANPETNEDSFFTEFDHGKQRYREIAEGQMGDVYYAMCMLLIFAFFILYFMFDQFKEQVKTKSEPRKNYCTFVYSHISYM